jgi:adenosylmethionine-8-amino-7-oxononanoate aminotransferase
LPWKVQHEQCLVLVKHNPALPAPIERLAVNLEALIEREGPETIAAFAAEPVIPNPVE